MPRIGRGLLSLGIVASVQGTHNCLSINQGSRNTSCTEPPSCTDTSQNMAHPGIPCRDAVAGNYYCNDWLSFGNADCTCYCEVGCEADPGDGTPLHWRPGNNPAGNAAGTGSGADGMVGLTQAQQDALVAQMNFVRAYHGACPLVWSDFLASNVYNNTAFEPTHLNCGIDAYGNVQQDVQYSPTLTRDARTTNPPSWGTIGETILRHYASFYWARQYPTHFPVMRMWKNHEPQYNYGTHTPTSDFTQMVWNDTRSVGCQMVQCNTPNQPTTNQKTVVLICHYEPVGNVPGSYASNVFGRGTNISASCPECDDNDGNDQDLAPEEPGDSNNGSCRTESIHSGPERMCAKTDAGRLRCWGRNDPALTGSGGACLLGYGDTSDRGYVSGEMGVNLSYIDLELNQWGNNPTTNLEMVSLGTSHTCIGQHHGANLGGSMEVGEIRCWGDGQYGQTGHGNIADTGCSASDMGGNLPMLYPPNQTATVPLACEVVQIVAAQKLSCFLCNKKPGWVTLLNTACTVGVQ